MYGKSLFSNVSCLIFQSHVDPEEELPEPQLPPMRMDVLGLKHDEIMNKVYCAHILLQYRL
jgi:hypothetical protein